MDQYLNKYAEKLVIQGICDPGSPILAGLDVGLRWNREGSEREILERVVKSLNITSLLFARPSEPYYSMINTLAVKAGNEGAIFPEDSETRTFLHDIPVIHDFSASSIVDALKRRKSVYVLNRGLVTFGTVTPEQAFITFSSVCFSAYVKFMTDLYYMKIRDALSIEHALGAIKSYQEHIQRMSEKYSLECGPFEEKDTIIRSMIEAGKFTVDFRMVDSFFGNISYRSNDAIFISQTGSSLDELSGCIDRCPLDGSSCAGVTASSEFSAHRRVYELKNCRAILHGHPKFSVIMSMICDKADCDKRGFCFRECEEPRFAGGIPVIPGEVGTGRFGLCNTMPQALAGNRGAIVYGHGLFTTGEQDFREAFSGMIDIEMQCLKEYELLIRK